MRICLFIRALHVGGAERQLAVLADDLLQAGHDVVVLTFYEGGRIEQELRARGVTCISVGKRGRWDIFRFLFRLVRTLRRLRPDVVYSMLQMANILSALVRPLIGARALVWGIRYADLKFGFYGRLHAWTMWMERRLSGVPDAIVTNSQAGKEFCVSRGYETSRLHVIENGIDTQRFRPSAEMRAGARAQWNIPEGVPVVGMVARFDPVKGHDLFAAAVAELRTTHPDVKAVFAGSTGDAATGLHAMLIAQALDNAALVLGDCPDVECVYNGLDVLCAPSLSEGFSNVVAEAMAAGTPCVVTDVGDSARIVGQYGLVLEERSVAALADALRRALSARNDPQWLHASIHQRFSREAAAHRVQRLFMELGVAGRARETERKAE